MLNYDDGTKKFIMRVLALLLCAACLITCFSSFFETLADGTNVSGDTITINYTSGTATGSTVTDTASYDSRLYSALLLDWDGFGSDNDTSTAATNSGNFGAWSYSGTISGTYIDGSGATVSASYIPAFAGWKLTEIVANGSTYDLSSSSYYYPDNDYIYTNDAPFSSYTEITSLTFEAVWGKTVYLRDQYNFTDLGNVYGDDAGIAIAKINWDTSSGVKASDTNSGATSSTPVASLSAAEDILGTTGGKIVIVNHYTFEAPDGYYYDTWSDTDGATSSTNSTNVTASSYYYDFGKNITTGVVTISGLNQGDATGEGKTADSASNYTNAHFYMKQTRGNGWYSNSGTKTTYTHLATRLRINCDTVIDGLNMLIYRDSWNLLGSRSYGDQYVCVYDDNRLVMESNVATVKRTTSQDNYGYDTTNWLYVAKTNTIGGSSVTCAKLGYDQNMLCISYSHKSNIAYNHYLTLRGSGGTSNSDRGYGTIYVGSFTSSNNIISNIHVNIENCYIYNLYGQTSAYKGDINFIGMSINNVIANLITPIYGSVNTDGNEYAIKEFAAVVDGDSTNYVTTSFYVGLYNTTSAGNMGTLNFTTVNFYMEGGKITNFYGGGNTVTCKSTGTFNFNIDGGAITSFYGGGNGGYMGSLTNACDININMTGGTVGDMYGGGAGGLVTLYTTSGVINLSGSYTTVGYDETDDNLWYEEGGTKYYYPSYTKYSTNGGTYYYYKLNPMNGNERPYTIYQREINDAYYTVLKYINVYYYGSGTTYNNFVSYYKSEYEYTISDAAVYADIDINISGGTVTGSVFGGGKNGSVTGDIDIEISGGSIGGSVYGGGYGNDLTFTNSNVTYSTIQFCFTADTTQAEVTTDSAIASANSNIDLFSEVASASGTSCYKYNNWVSGQGGSLASTDYYMTVSEFYNKYASDGSYVYIYCSTINLMGTITGDTTVNISGGSITGSVYGGSYGAVASIQGDTQVTISGSSTTIGGSVFGGGNAGAVTGNTVVTLKGGTLSGSNSSVYGGGNQASVGTDGANNSVTVTITDGTIGARVYGGGNAGDVYGNITLSISGGTFSSSTSSVFGGCDSADVNGSITVNVTGNSGTIINVFGGNNASGSITGDINVNISQASSKTTTIKNLYGGGNAAAYSGTATVTVTEGTVQYLYGGGLKASVTTTNINISGSNTSVEQVFGGGSEGDAGNTNVTVTGGTVTYLYGGGKKGDVSGNTTVTISGGSITGVYGGGYEGNVAGSTSVSVTGGSVSTLYGGGYQGTTGSTNVVVSGGTISNALYGGGRDGSVNGSTNVLINGGSVYTIYGGGYGSSASVTTTGVAVSGGSVTGSIYGGGNLGDVTTSASVTLSGGSVANNIYGGGLNGNVTGNTTVAVSGSTTSVGGRVYGGGYEGGVTGSTTVAVTGGTVSESVYGGGYAGNIAGATSVAVSSGVITGSVYGGGYDGDVGATASASSTTVAVTGGEMASVYGGGYNGDIYGSAAVSISDADGTTTINGGVYGAGYGEKSCVTQSTAVTIDLSYRFTATESAVSVNSLTSGEIETLIEETSGYDSVIKGSVYGGGNLGTVGEGDINTSTNTATISTAATTTVTVKSGHIKGSVYGGGYGVPATGVTYNIYMGTVFGETEVNIGGDDSGDYVYIEGNVFGGGSQSRVYTADATAATVNISSANSSYIALGGSVFGGGERGNSANTNASVATTVGNVYVNITGQSTGATIYFVKGGVYGDGNLCLVTGTRTIVITNLTTGSRIIGNLKTFYSLQRADTATLSNSQVVLLGAVDLVAEGDSTVYSINRITTLKLTNGSTIKLDSIVNYLENLSSDVYNSRTFINGGYNGANSYNSGALINALDSTDPTETSTYITCAINGEEFNGTYYTNTVCVANGLSLELRTTSGGYGAVTGLFTLSLLYAVEGEGGGFVYADIANSTGDFICITKYSDGGDYMAIVDDVGGYTSGNTYTYYYWYIQGTTISYSLEVTGYIGTSVTDYDDSGTVPKHTATRYYVLHDVDVDTSGKLAEAVTGNNPTYELVQASTGLTGQQISIEVMIGSTSLGFLYYDTTGWGIYVNASTICYGLAGNGSTDLGKNILTPNGITVTDGYDTISFVLHKSSEVTTELKEMSFTVTIYLYEQDGGSIGNAVSDGTSQLVVSGTANIVRLVPTQTIYKTTGKNYAGINTSSDTITITEGSSFSVQYQTKYIPAAFTSTASTPMTWALSTEEFEYYTDAGGNYLTINATTGTCAGITATLTFNGGAEPQTGVGTFIVYKDDNGVYYYYTSYNNATDNVKVTMDDQSTTTYASKILAGTKITMIDLTNANNPVYYYYICSADTTYINLDSFYVMGSSTTTIGDLTTTPAYKAIYSGSGNANSQVTENLIFIFDFEEATSETGGFRVQLQHLYKETDDSHAIDMMDFVQTSTKEGVTSYSRTVPKPTEYTITDKDGYTLEAKFEDDSYYDLDTAVLNVKITEDDSNVNTRLAENEYAIKIELIVNNEAVSFPVGMLFRYENNGEYYTIAASGTYVIIPVQTSGTHTIYIINELYSLMSVAKGNTATFKVTLYSAPDASYYNYIEWSSVTAGYTIAENLTYALSVTATTGSTANSQVLAAGETLKFTVKTACSDTSNSEGVEVALMKKNDVGEYEAVTLDSLFTNSGDVAASTTGQGYSWTISGSAAAGTYRLVFTYGDHTEYLNVIVY